MVITTDPVCGKRIDSTDAVTHTRFNNRTYYFCSEECRRTFDAGPQQHTEHLLPTTCAVCGGSVSQGDLVCPHCGTNLVAG